MDAELTAELTTELITDFTMSDLTTSALLIYNFNLDDIIGFFMDLTYPCELSEMSGTMTDLT